MPKVKRSQATWAITDGHAGNHRQASALAAALSNDSYQNLSVRARAPWRWFSPRRCWAAHAAFGAEFAQRLQQPPALAIGCGRQAALATRLLRTKGSYSVQILDPRLNPRHWDVLVVPEHDRVRGDNVLTLLGSLNPIDDDWLQQARDDFPELAQLPSPRLVLLLGGPSAHVPWQPEQAGQLCAQLASQARLAGGSLLVSASRRTPSAAILALRPALRELPSLLWRNLDDGRNPYCGLLGWADAVVATADSVNLLSEACATHVPVASALATASSGRLAQFQRALQQRGRLCEIQALLQPDPAIVPLRETARIAAQIRQRLQLASAPRAP